MASERAKGWPVRANGPTAQMATAGPARTKRRVRGGCDVGDSQIRTAGVKLERKPLRTGGRCRAPWSVNFARRRSMATTCI